MIEKKDIQEAIEKRKSLFFPGAEISQETYEFLCQQTVENIEMLFADMPKTKPKEPSHLYVHFKCQRCFSPMTVKLTKKQFRTCFNGGFPSLIDRYTNLRYGEEAEIVYSLNLLGIEKGVTNLKGVCDDCIRSFRKKIEGKFGEFYNRPLVWVNTNSPDKHSWQWNRVVKLYAYPLGYENRPEGWKYCGVRIKDRDSKSTTDYFDSDYYNWKTIKEKTVVEKRLTTTREVLNELLGNIKNSDETPAAHKKAMSIAEILIEGLSSDTDLTSILEYVSRESSRLLEKIKKNSSPDRILNFGKYKGMSVHNVIEIDPEYIYWALTVVEGFTLTDDEKAHYNGEDWMVEKDCKTQDIQEETLSEEREESSKEKEDEEEYRPLKADALPF